MRLSKIKREPKKKIVALRLHPLCLSGWELVPCICLRLYTGQTDYQLLLAKLCYSSAVWFVNPSVNTKKVVVPLAGKWFKRCDKFPIATQWVMGSSQCTEECITSLWSVDCWTHTKICYRFQCYNLSVVFHLSFSWNKYIKTRWCLALWNNFIAPQHFPWWKLAMRSLPPSLRAERQVENEDALRDTRGVTAILHSANRFLDQWWIGLDRGPNYQHHLYANTCGDRAANW